MIKRIGTPCNPEDAVRNLITGLIRRSTMSRIEIVEKLSLHVGRKISKRMLDDWTAESKKRARFPACFVQVFCEVIKDDRLQRHLLSERLRKLLSVGEAIDDLYSGNVSRRKMRKRSKR
jgi:hypothetical protein